MEDAEYFLKSVQKNDINAIKNMLRENENLLKHEFEKPGKTILHKAGEMNTVTEDTLKILLDASEDNEIQKLFKYVSEEGYYEKVKFLINNYNATITIEILCWTIKYSNEKESGMCNFDICSNIILDKLESQNDYEININGLDELGYPPLHYSLRYCDNNKSMRLLKLGASLACRNIHRDFPIKYIKYNFFKEFLDSCLNIIDKKNRLYGSNKNIEEEYLAAAIEYKCLVPPRNKKLKLNDIEALEKSSTTYKSQCETEGIKYMSKVPELRSLITHPVVVSLLLMKWHRIRLLFYINLIFYCLFLISLNFYILNYYSKSSLVRPTISSGLPFVILVILHSTFWVLVLRELSQMVISTKLYFRDYDNFVEIILIFVSEIILYVDFFDFNRRIISSIAILLSAYEFLIMGGQNMHFATYVVMFQTVTKNFLKLLLLYSMLIISFALTFHILFATTDEENETNKHYKTAITTNDNSTFEALMEQNFSNSEDTSKGSSQSTDVFKSLYYSIFKTILMLTGEFNSDSLNFNTYPTASRIIICLFVFTISITLLNLLNGLAVSDTQKIQNDAKFVAYVALVHRISYVESMLFSKLPPWLVNKLFKFLGFIIKNPCIFTSYETCLYIYPNLNKEVSTDKKKDKEIKTISQLTWYQFYWYCLNHVCLKKKINQNLIALIMNNYKNYNQ